MKVIPFQSGASWSQQIEIEKRFFNIRVQFNIIGRFWTIDISTLENEPIMSGVKLVLGVDFFSAIADPRLPPGHLFVFANAGCGCTPGRFDFNSNAWLVYVPVQ